MWDAARVRECLEDSQFEAAGYGDAAVDIRKRDDILEAAAAAAILGNPAFLGIIDAGFGRALRRDPSLAGGRCRSRAEARGIEDQITMFLGYYSQTAYMKSVHFHRVLGSMAVEPTQDDRGPWMSPGARVIARAGRKALERARAATNAIVVADLGLVGSAVRSGLGPGHLSTRGLLVTVETTKAGKQFVRALSRESASRGLTLATCLSVKDPRAICLRCRPPARSLEVYAKREDTSASAAAAAALAEPLDKFWEAVDAAVQKIERLRDSSAGVSSGSGSAESGGAASK